MNDALEVLDNLLRMFDQQSKQNSIRKKGFFLLKICLYTV
jgi:hypothetical protein